MCMPSLLRPFFNTDIGKEKGQDIQRKRRERRPLSRACVNGWGHPRDFPSSRVEFVEDRCEERVRGDRARTIRLASALASGRSFMYCSCGRDQASKSRVRYQSPVVLRVGCEKARFLAFREVLLNGRSLQSCEFPVVEQFPFSPVCKTSAANRDVSDQ
ncbi:basic phospholipase A2 Drk-b1 [Striga asiatica]|uniref:Basic phospholipase A2 Drk-b1 n=1 Tax=Striga asiatica TaxID=4170 RepID=A0A5A7Q1V9_STRAF|nr:basic phospholipase A2 Drk-b1 [Striga asiatica]